MLDKSFLEKIEQLAVAAGETVIVGGVEYSAANLKPIISEWQPKALPISTLTAFAEYIKRNPEGLKIEDLFVHIDDPATVRLLGKFEGTEKKRPEFVTASMPAAKEFNFGSYMNAEEMTIALRTLFVPNDDLTEIVYLLTKIDISNGISIGDDGISQNIEVKKGISGAVKDGKTTKGFYRLRPYRTFLEIEQPESEFLFRLKIGNNGEPIAALYTAGGNMWHLTAIESIRVWLSENLPEGTRILA